MPRRVRQGGPQCLSSDPRHRIEHCAMCPRSGRAGTGPASHPVVQPTHLWDFGGAMSRLRRERRRGHTPPPFLTPPASWSREH
jgi:hypothetical protein